MQWAFWGAIQSFIIAPLRTMRGQNARRVPWTFFYAVLSALVLVGVGFFIHLILLFQYYNEVDPWIVLFIIGLILAFLNNVYNGQSTFAKIVKTVIGGIFFSVVLFATTVIYWVAKYYRWSLLEYGYYLLALVIILFAAYWVLTDRPEKKSN